MLKRNARARKGFTLVETIASILILTIAIPPMLWSIRQAHVQRVNPMMASKARWLATEKLEDVIADRHSTTRGFGYLIPANYPAEIPVSGFTNFSRTVSFNLTGPDLVSPGTGYLKVTVTVGWTDATSTARSLAIATVVTEY
ncbi:MAG: type II secretion system GspH family protein [Phycisphaerales bacterium]|nr:type II secretion system GspH family protein [Phycisphaerales bacterium]MCI0631634.1 type II secretion system GspH family protein [Phycisphaerales bacterium]MCI0675380.1 type II secretion system GspH family protein [Phycisphaerales bacterium]